MSQEQMERSQRKMRRVLESYFSRARQARLMLGAVIVCTGAVGFGLSVALLHGGVTSMAVRYPLAVLGAWGAFLGLIRGWVALERRRFDPDSPELRSAMANPESDYRLSESTGSWLDWLDLSHFEWPDLDSPGCLLAIIVGIAVGLGALLLALFGMLPALAAELFVDIALSSLLYRRLKHAATEHWLGTCIRRTGSLVFAAIVLMGFGGWLLDRGAPGSNTIGKAVREIYNAPSRSSASK